MKGKTQTFSISSLLNLVSTILLVLFTTSGALASGDVNTIRNPVADFDGDGKSDISVFRPSNGYWYILKSSGGFMSVKWGLETDNLVPGDYDGDGKTDLAVHRIADFYSGEYDNYFYIRRSSDDSFLIKKWGVATGFTYDAPHPSDYDGDGKTDIATYHGMDVLGPPSYFTILQSSDETRVVKYWGISGDRIVSADYDGDGKTDLAVFRTFTANANHWFILQSSNNAIRTVNFGIWSDRHLPADYDGDGKADIAVWRPSDGTWYRINSSDNSINVTQFGQSADKPVPADYDGDGKTDIAVFRPSTGIWYIQRSREGFLAVPFGSAEDKPIPGTR